MIFRRIIGLLLLFSFIQVSYLNAQTYSFRRYTVHDGLPQSQVMYVFQDSRGFIWIITKNGLSRFDGIEFINYFTEDGLPGNFLLSIEEDINHNIWVLHPTGLSIFDGKRFEYLQPPAEFSNMKFIGMKLYPDGEIWLQTLDQDILIFSNWQYHHISDDFPEFRQLKCVSNYIRFPEDQKLWVITTDGLVYDLTVDSLKLLTSKKIRQLDWVNDQLYAFGRDTVYEVSGKSFVYHSKTVEPYGNPFKSHIRQTGDVVLIQHHGYLDNTRWPYGRITDSFIDADSSLWIWAEDGLYRLMNPAMLNYTIEDGIAPMIWSMVESRDKHIWFASFTRRIQEYDGQSFTERSVNKEFPIANFYMGACLLSTGELYFPYNDGVLSWNGSSFSRVDWVKSMTENIFENHRNHAILVGSTQELVYHQNGRTRYFPEFNDGNLGYVRHITIDRKGFYWLVTSKNFYRFDGDSIYFFDKDSLPFSGGWSIETDSTGNIWIGGQEGLFCYNQLEKRFIQVLQGLRNETVYFVKLMDQHHLMAGRMEDIVIVNLDRMARGESPYYRIYDQTDGFLGTRCGQNGILKDSHGLFWIATSDRVVRFDPDRMCINKNPPRLHIISVESMNDSLQWKEVTFLNPYRKEKMQELTLDYHHRALRVHFTGISTSNPEKVMYRHRLTGSGEQWTNPTPDRSVIYTGLRPGHYSFDLQAANSDDIWTQESASLSFRIIPAYWQTATFWIAISLITITVITLILWFIFRYREKNRKEREERLREYTRLQVNGLVRQFDPHFLFNMLSMASSMVMRGEKDLANTYLVKISGLLRTVLQEHDKLTKSLEEELDFVRQYCEIQKFRLSERFDYEIEVSQRVKLSIEMPKMLIQNFVENAIKHGIEPKDGVGTVRIKIDQDGYLLVISIVDDGIGRVAAARLKSGGMGLGEKNTERIITLMNSLNRKKIRFEITDRADEKGNAAGTEVKIFIPTD